MELTLTPEQQAFVQLAVANGRVHSEEEAVQQALAQWEERERVRLEFIATLDEARASLDRGEGRTLRNEDEIREYFEMVKARGRARLAEKI